MCSRANVPESPGGTVGRTRGRHDQVERLSAAQHGQVDGHIDTRPRSEIEQRLDGSQALAIDCRDAIADFQAGQLAGPLGRERLDLVLAGDRPVRAVETDAHWRQVAHQVHPLHAVRRQQRAEDERQWPARDHTGSVRRIRPVLKC